MIVSRNVMTVIGTGMLTTEPVHDRHRSRTTVLGRTAQEVSRPYAHDANHAT